MLCHQACNRTTTHKTQTAKRYTSCRDWYRIQAYSGCFKGILDTVDTVQTLGLELFRKTTIVIHQHKLRSIFGWFSFLTTFSERMGSAEVVVVCRDYALDTPWYIETKTSRKLLNLDLEMSRVWSLKSKLERDQVKDVKVTRWQQSTTSQKGPTSCPSLSNPTPETKNSSIDPIDQWTRQRFQFPAEPTETM